MFNDFNLSNEEIMFLIEKYEGLIYKASKVNFKFDEDLNQEIKLHLLRVLSRGRRKNKKI